MDDVVNDNDVNAAELRRETEAYLKKIRQTIRDGKNLVAQAELGIAETDRLLEKEGLTREQLNSLTFTDEQLAAVNEELKRRGLPPLEDVKETTAEGVRRQDNADKSLRGGGLPPAPDATERDGSVDNRKRKFGVMMQQFRM